MAVKHIFLVLLATLSFNLSYARVIGDWFVDDSSPESLYAATTNDSGALFGQICYASSGNCFWTIGMATSCNKGNKYPVLANSDAGVAQLEIFCTGTFSGGLYGYAFTNFDQVENIVKQATRVGFAVPLQSDQFRVVRFQLTGAIPAIDAMHSSATKRKVPIQRGTRDQIM